MPLRFRAVKARKRKTDPTHPRKASVCPRALFFLFFIVWNQMPTNKHKYAFPFYSSPLPRFQKNTTPLTTHQPNHTPKSRKTTKTHLSSPLLFLFFRSKLLQMASSSAQGSGYDFSFKILLIGDSGVGKSSLLVSFISNAVDDPSPTIGIS